MEILYQENSWALNTTGKQDTRIYEMIYFDLIARIITFKSYSSDKVKVRILVKPATRIVYGKIILKLSNRYGGEIRATFEAYPII